MNSRNQQKTIDAQAGSELSLRMVEYLVLASICTSIVLYAVASDDETMDSQKQPISTSDVLKGIDKGIFEVLESGETYSIYLAGVKRYGDSTLIVQSSNTPISLGREMLPLMNTENFWKYIGNHEIEPLQDSPKEIYLYNWIGKAQGKMIFDVGVAVRKPVDPMELPDWLKIKTYEAMKFFSLIYVGPFPHEQGSGWANIRWEDRAKEFGHTYDERLYRELYHRYDYLNFQHVTEVQISIE